MPDSQDTMLKQSGYLHIITVQIKVDMQKVVAENKRIPKSLWHLYDDLMKPVYQSSP